MKGGVDLGGTKIQAVVVDDGYSVLGQARRPTPTEGGPPDVVAEMAAAVREAAAGAVAAGSSLTGVGVGSPGAVDAATGTVSEARNLPGWEGSFPLASALEQALGCPVALGNDVQVAVDAEFTLGAGKPYGSLLGVFWGTGIGGGIVLDHRLWLGRGAAGEVGHTVVKRDGAHCTCGRRGCVEAYAGRAAMEARARKLVEQGDRTILFELMEHKGRSRLVSSIWARALEKQDKMAIHLVDRAIGALGTGIASAVNLLDVEAVMIGGGLGTRLGEPYVERIEAEMMPHLFMDDRPPAVAVAALGDLGGAIGAAMLVDGAAASSSPR